VDLSIIIVNYNVKHFLKQCLQSVSKALDGIEAEVIVVDNASIDYSYDYISTECQDQDFTWIQNEENVGFSKANNQGLEIAKGRYCLLLNPDTIVKSDTFRKCIDYMDTEQKVGALGIKMVDGSGHFLPESKRSFPTPEVAFYKLFGLARLFPKSNKFGKYHLTYFDKDGNHPVDVLSGAFFFARTDLMNKIGGLDEQFFMYGEDIDLSYRLIQEGYQNVYFSDSSILHYKGESAKRGSLNFVRNFYQAMIIFAEKHYASKKQRLFVFIMSIAIRLRATIALLSSFFKKIGLPLLDLSMSFLLLHFIKNLWLTIKPEIRDYSDSIYYINFPIYLLLGLVTMFISGAYDSPYKLSKILRGGVYTLLVIAIVYAFLPSEHRFSRAMVVYSSIVISAVLVLNRMIIQYLRHGSFSFYRSKKKSFLLLGNVASLKIKGQLLSESPLHSFLGLVTKQSVSHPEKVGGIHQIENILEQLQPSDVIVDTKEISFDHLIQMLEDYGRKTRFHTSYDLGETIISSHEGNINGDVFERANQFQLSLPSERRKKRYFDIFTSLLLLLASPVLFWFQKRKLKYLKNSVLVLLGVRTWVGYSNGNIEHLPSIKRGILSTNGIKKKEFHTDAIEKELNYRYAKNYTYYEDLDILSANWNRL